MNFLIENWTVIAGIFGLFGPIAGYFTGLRVQKSLEKEKEADALSNVQQVYNTFTAHTKDQIIALQEQIKALTADLQSVKQENLEQRKDIRELQRENRELHKDVSKLTKENEELRKVVAELRKENEELRKIVVELRKENDYLKKNKANKKSAA